MGIIIILSIYVEANVGIFLVIAMERDDGQKLQTIRRGFKEYYIAYRNGLNFLRIYFTIFYLSWIKLAVRSLSITWLDLFFFICFESYLESYF